MDYELLSLIMFGGTILALLLGFPVAMTLGGSALIFAYIGDGFGLFNSGMLNVFPLRILGIMKNEPLIAVPLFVFMGVMLEKSNIAGDLLHSMGSLFGNLRGGLGISVLLVGALMAASTGIVGATVVTMGLMSMPVMLRAGYSPKLASGLICASGTLGQIIPPSIVLIILGDILQGANEQAAFKKGVLVPEPITAIDLFAGALLPGLIMVVLYILLQIFLAIRFPKSCPAITQIDHIVEGKQAKSIYSVIIPPLILIILVLGSILAGIATPTESAAVGAVGAVLLAVRRGSFSYTNLMLVSRETVKITSMIFMILIGASLFSLVFRGFGGDQLIEQFLANLPGGEVGAFVTVMLVMFLMGFFLDFIEIIFIMVPLVGPPLIGMGFDPIWLGIMIAVNLQTSFLTPPFGFSLFYLRGVAPPEVRTNDIYLGVLPFIGLQLFALLIFWTFPNIISWLPELLF
jgi:tripartite ATP-independent transporter DctM subunit